MSRSDPEPGGGESAAPPLGTNNNAASKQWTPPRGKIPNEWGSGKPANKGVGRRWVDPNNLNANGVRIDKGNPDNSQPTQQIDHVIVRKDGRVIGRDGRPIQGAVSDDPINAHIPLQEWINWRKWYEP